MADLLTTGQFNVRKRRRAHFGPVRLLRTFFIFLALLLLAMGLWGILR